MTKLEIKIGTSLIRQLRNGTCWRDGRSRVILIQQAWHSRAKFAQLANDNPGFAEAMFDRRDKRNYAMGVT